jgi:guanylate kinase
MAQTGNLYVIAAPSGTGKTSLVKALCDSMNNLSVSISHTTRPMRPNEKNGINYFFIDQKTFKEMILLNEFLEHATVFGNFYGTSRGWVEDTLNQGIDVILEIDWQGHEQIKKLFPHAIGIFILPPSLSDLRDRLLKRNQDDNDTIEKRMADVREAVSHVDDFEYLVMNDDFDVALRDLKTIINAGRLLAQAQHRKYAGLIADLSKITAT